MRLYTDLKEIFQSFLEDSFIDFNISDKVTNININKDRYKMNENIKNLNIKIPLDMHKRLKALAAVQCKSMKTIILESIEKKLDTIHLRKDS